MTTRIAALNGSRCKRAVVSCAVACVLATIGRPAAAQSGAPVKIQPAQPYETFAIRLNNLDDVVRGAPYSGEGVTTVTQTLGDGTHIDQTVTAKVYRDAEGRERREQTIVGLGTLSQSNDAVVTIIDPIAKMSYTLDPKTRTARQVRLPIILSANVNANQQGGARVSTMRVMIPRVGAGLPSSGTPASGPPAPPPPSPPPPPPAPPGGDIQPRIGPGQSQSLGTRQIEGVAAVGTMTRSTIPAGQIGNDRPIEITDEQWTSPDLKVLVLSKHHDPRSGDVEYQLTNIIRGEPPADLFAVPPDYTVIGAPPIPPPPPAPGE